MATRTAKQVKRKPKRRSAGIFRHRWVRFVAGSFIILFFLLAVGSGVVYYFAIQELQRAAGQIGTLDDLKSNLQISPSVIKSADGKVLYTMIQEDRKWMKLQDIPQVVRDATIAAEDKRFFEHQGVDYMSMARVLFTSGQEGRVTGGASTLTMQLAKRLYSKSEKTINRKVRDMALAIQIEKKYTKEQILELYLNQVFYGTGAYGVARAASVYFGKSLDKLTAAEAATLARLVRRPSTENPFKNPKVALFNRNVVLDIMRDEKMLTEAEYQAARNEPLKLARLADRARYGTRDCYYFVDYVLDQLKKSHPEVDIEEGGYTVVTTIDTRMQRIAERELAQAVARFKWNKVTTGSFVLVNNTGQILAMCGGVDYDRNQFNIATSGRRQSGSAFKPFVYALAFEKGTLGPNDSISNGRFSIRLPSGGFYTPGNSSGNYGGMVSVRTAIAISLNVPAVRALDGYALRTGGGSRWTGLERFVTSAKNSFGFDGRLPAVPSLALGTAEVSLLELAEGYSVFQNGGTRVEPYAIRAIKTQSGEVLFEQGRGDTDKYALRRDVADAMDSMLRAVVTSGTGKEALRVVNSRGKTGTTNDNKDAWFAGYTDKLIGIGWIGNENKVDLPGGKYKWVYGEMGSRVYGGTHTCEIWTAILKECQALVGETKSRDMRDSEGWATEPGTQDGDGDDRRPNRRDTSGDPEIPTPRDLPPEDLPQQNPDDPPQEAPASPERSEDPGSDARPTPPADSSPPPPETSQRSTITVLICSDSGLKAGSNCPEKSARTYRSGREPKRSCPLH